MWPGHWGHRWKGQGYKLYIGKKWYAYSLILKKIDLTTNWLLLLVVLQLEIWEKVNTEKLREDLQKLLDKGIQSLAVVLLHSYTWVSMRASLTLHGTNSLLSTHESY